MTPEQYQQLKSVFHESEALAPDDRRAFIESRCEHDEEMLRTASLMLKAEERSSATGSDPVASALGTSPSDARTPTQIEDFTILKELGSGAVGTVYEAEQGSPKRAVALKVMRRANPSERLAQRFALESEILGRLVHPGIAQVYASGIATTPEGPRHYIAMELVPGEPITRWAERTGADVSARLALFARVCDAVHYAHQRGVIHRDLKPANIFVDSEGNPKVLDFGIARALDEGGTATPMGTMQGEILGTLEYMSPEQAGGDADEVDVRTDVYALGAVLFELVSGRAPINTKGLALAPALDAVRTARRSRLREADPSIGADLDIVVATALDLDRERRYATPDAFSNDVRRLLANEPILARAPSMSYQLLKFAQRRRATVAALLLIGLTLIGATAFSLHAASRAESARQREAGARAQAVEAQKDAEREREEAELTLALVTDALTAANPNIEGTADYTVRAFLSDFASTLDNEGVAPSESAEAQLRTAIGDAFIGLGDPDRAIEQLTRAVALRVRTVGAAHERTIQAKTLLGVALLDAGRTDEGRDLLAQNLDRAIASLGENHDDTVQARFYLASAHYKAGEIERSEPLFRALYEADVQKHGIDHPDTTSSMTSYALVLQRLKKYDEALPLNERALEIDTRTLGPSHVSTLTTRNNLALLYMQMGRYEEARDHFEAVLEARERELPPGHRHIGVSLSSLGRVYAALGEFERAEDHALRAHEHLLTNLGPDHPYTGIARTICASVYEAWGKDELAAQWRPE